MTIPLPRSFLGILIHIRQGVTPSLQMSTTFVRDAENALVRPDNSYGRDQNDGVRLAEDVIAALEGAEDSLLFPSGMAAIAAIFQALPTGSRVLVQSGIYWGTTKFIGDQCCAPWNGCRFY